MRTNLRGTARIKLKSCAQVFDTLVHKTRGLLTLRTKILQLSYLGALQSFSPSQIRGLNKNCSYARIARIDSRQSIETSVSQE